MKGLQANKPSPSTGEDRRRMPPPSMVGVGLKYWNHTANGSRVPSRG